MDNAVVFCLYPNITPSCDAYGNAGDEQVGDTNQCSKSTIPTSKKRKPQKHNPKKQANI